MATALTDGDEEAAVEYGRQIAGVDSSLDTCISLVGGDAISDGLSMALKNLSAQVAGFDGGLGTGGGLIYRIVPAMTRTIR